MDARTKYLHFRATPGERAAIIANAKGWESLSSYLVEAALEYKAPASLACCGASARGRCEREELLRAAEVLAAHTQGFSEDRPSVREAKETVQRIQTGMMSRAPI